MKSPLQPFLLVWKCEIMIMIMTTQCRARRYKQWVLHSLKTLQFLLQTEDICGQRRWDNERRNLWWGMVWPSGHSTLWPSGSNWAWHLWHLWHSGHLAPIEGTPEAKAEQAPGLSHLTSGVKRPDEWMGQRGQRDNRWRGPIGLFLLLRSNLGSF